MSVNHLEIRRSIVRLAIGQSVTISTTPETHAAAERLALSFGKAKKIPLAVQGVKGGLVITRTEPVEAVSLYPEIDRLEVGESHVFPYPPAFHTRVRVAASFRNRKGKVRLACTREGDQIRVTRLPMTAEETATSGPIKAQGRQSKYRLEQLDQVRELLFPDCDAYHQQRIRQAASMKAKQRGWTVRCRLQDDGSMLVYRTDAGAPLDAQAQAAE